MTAITFEILLILLLAIANGIFASSEMAVVSARKVRLEQLMKQGNRKAQLALKLANSPNDFLSSVQIGITLIGILSGAVGGAKLASRLENFFNTVPGLSPYSEPLGILIVVSGITYLSLVLGELVPKRIALNRPEQIACAVAQPLDWLAIATTPVIKLLSISTEGLLKLLGIKASGEPAITEEEIKGLVELGARAGTVEVAEKEMVSRVFRLDDRSINSIMTPRIEVAWLDVNASWDENQRRIQTSPYSQYPVCQESIDYCLGIIRTKDIWATAWSGETPDLRQLLRPPLYVPERVRALKVLENFQTAVTHMALITDEYGGIEGIVTLNDLVEAIVGELPSLEDVEDPAILQRDDGSWLLDGLLSVETLKELLKLERLPDEAEEQYHTLGGFMMTLLEHIPRSGEHFNALGYRFEVVDMDGTRVDKVWVAALPAEGDMGPAALSEAPESLEDG
ncbi:MAG: hemolysin family protein [Cyanobacteria bacterium J06626_23]